MAYTTKRCGDCQYWDVAPNKPDVERASCRRFPPMANFSTVAGRWPLTLASDWCWEFKARTQDTAE